MECPFQRRQEPVGRLEADDAQAGDLRSLKKRMSGGPNREKYLSSALSSASLAVTSALISVNSLIYAAMVGSAKVYFSIALHEMHQLA